MIDIGFADIISWLPRSKRDKAMEWFYTFHPEYPNIIVEKNGNIKTPKPAPDTQVGEERYINSLVEIKDAIRQTFRFNALKEPVYTMMRKAQANVNELIDKAESKTPPPAPDKWPSEEAKQKL